LIRAMHELLDARYWVYVQRHRSEERPAFTAGVANLNIIVRRSDSGAAGVVLS
jgi:hypothetical protein